MKKVFVAVVLIWCVSGCAQSGQTISPTDFETKLGAEKNKIVLDVRTSDEFASGHIANAQMIDFYKSDFKANLVKLSKEKTIFVYCAGGVRSHQAVTMLEELGFKKVIELKGGYKAWVSAGKPVVK